MASVHRDLTWHPGRLTEDDRAARLGQRGAIVWFTGLSGSGKSTLARELEVALVSNGKNAVVLDGDNIRLGLNKDAALLEKESHYPVETARRFGLGFSAEDRTENIRRIGEVAKLFAVNNVVAITAFISPFRSDRDAVRALAPAGRFFEIHVATPLSVCEERDPKGLYKKARAGEIAEFTGLTSAYEAPLTPELTLHTERESLRDSTARVIALLQEKGVL